MRRRILFVGGSMNQTTVLHRVAQELDDHDCQFTPHYADGALRRLAEGGRLDFTTLGRPARRRALDYFVAHKLPIDERGQTGRYDLVVTCSDLIVPRNVRGRPLVLVQEGMPGPEDLRYRLVRTLGLPRYLANTSMTGLSRSYCRFCVASAGFRDLFIAKGVAADRIAVTGLPGFDDVEAYRINSFPHRDYVLAATSCLRETLELEDRRRFIRDARRVAAGRPLLFKLHPNERIDRAWREIERFAPEALVFGSGDTNEMVANCAVLVARRSTAALVAVALGKEVHCDVPARTLKRLAPVQNGGRAARLIGEVCRAHLC